MKEAIEKPRRKRRKHRTIKKTPVNRTIQCDLAGGDKIEVLINGKSVSISSMIPISVQIVTKRNG